METFDDQTAEAIQSIFMSITGGEDKLIWHFTPRCIYTVSSGYQLLTNSIRDNKLPTIDWKKIWDRQVPHKVKTFMWRLVHDNVATRDNLRLRIRGVDNSCNMSRVEAKIELHLFTRCQFTPKV
ncbi:Reverse transcriptase zinc-binding domain [Quillaja saponaria]|uniref:Reverse transcriptase zinc-binding domain n=1 Tax=Quillaja saponaria TaxID=32244 RepID=A0AAD7M510_QUISA|nr:Reverse transcriptase zinc-binding domain [Quillaja saponaria]